MMGLKEVFASPQLLAPLPLFTFAGEFLVDADA
jgi:hypothetical protein